MATPGWSLKRLLLAGATILVVLPAVAAGAIYTSKVRKQTVDLWAADCVSAWNKAPVSGVIGVQTGPL
jgi:hypothetical protein